MDLDNSVDFKDAVAGEDFGEEIDGKASNESALGGCNAQADLERSVDLRDISSSALTPLSMLRSKIVDRFISGYALISSVNALTTPSTSLEDICTQLTN